MLQQNLSTEISTRIPQDFVGSKRLPSERVLAERYSCTRGTIRSALSLLRENGLLNSASRQGHVLQLSAKTRQASKKNNKTPVIAHINVGDVLFDAQHMDVIAGVVRQISDERMNCIMCELARPEQIDALVSFSDLHPGLDVSGYIVTGRMPARLNKILSSSARPCVMYGVFLNNNDNGPQKFMQVQAPVEVAYSQVAKRLVELGHEKILLGFGGSLTSNPTKLVINAFEKEFLAGDLSTDGIDYVADDVFNLNEDFIVLAKYRAQKIIDSLKPEHTALVLSGGGRCGFEVWSALIASGRKIPEDLSVVIASGRHDSYVEINDITTIYSDGFREGGACIRMLAKQIRQQTIECGIRYSELQYLERSTIAPVKKGVRAV